MTVKSFLAIGLSTSPAKLKDRMPGHPNPGGRTWGYHGDDANLFDNRDFPERAYEAGTYGPGDVVGCGLDFEKGTIFYTLNQKKYGNSLD